MQALQRVHRSRSIGLPLVQLASNAPSQPRRARVRRPACTAIARSCGSAPPAPVTAGSPRACRPASRRAQRRHRPRRSPARARRPVADRRHRLGRAAAARRRSARRSSATRRVRVLRPAAGLADVDEADRPLVDARRAFGLPFSSRNSRLSCVQATSRSSPLLAARWNAPASRRHSSVWTVSSPAPASGPRAWRQGRAVQRHRPVAVADQGLHRHGSGATGA